MTGKNHGGRSLNEFADGWKRSFEATGRLPSAYLFVGPPGSGKEETASQIIDTLLGRAAIQPDLIRIVPEKNSIKIEQVRDLIRRLSLKPFGSGHLIVMIEEAEAMTLEAANALLKTLEEPPPGTLFILSAEADETLPTTIRSRCQRVVFPERKESSRTRLEEVFRGLQDDLTPLLEGKQASFSLASQMAESFAARPDSIDSLLTILQTLWHDSAVWRHSGEEASLLLPAAAEITRRLANQTRSEKIFEDCDLIAETIRAVEGNVHKLLALERLFVKLMS